MSQNSDQGPPDAPVDQRTPSAESNDGSSVIALSLAAKVASYNDH